MGAFQTWAQASASLTSEFVLPGVHSVLLRGLLDGPEVSQDSHEVTEVDDVAGLVSLLFVVAGNSAALKHVCAPGRETKQDMR